MSNEGLGHSTHGWIGASIRRLEDPRFLQGQGQFATDIRPFGCLQAAILRSPHGHARIRSIEVGAARAMPGVVGVFTAADLGTANQSLPLVMNHPKLRAMSPKPLADVKVHHVGEAVAVVVAESRYLAEDALDAITVEYEPLPAVVTVREALEPGAPIVHESLGDNLAIVLTHVHGDVDAAFRAADVVVKEHLTLGRSSGQAMETRAVTAEYRPTAWGVSLTVWNSTQSPHTARRCLATMLGMATRDIRMIAPDIGGGFGVKNRFYPEEALIPWLAKHLERPVQWIEDRREDFLTTYQAREQDHEIELAARSDGTFLGARIRILHDAGAYAPFGVVVPWNSAETMVGPYHFPTISVDMRSAYTNKPGNAPYRGAGRPSGTFSMERMVDLLAREVGLSPAEIRSRNFIQPADMPYTIPIISRDGAPIEYDSGDYPGAMNVLMQAVNEPAFRARQASARAEGRYLGLGLACYVERTGTGPFEGATVRVESDGHVLVMTGATPQGQGHQTVYAQVCAERLGVRPEDVTVITGDTAAIALGVGTSASRSAVTAGNAVSQASQGLKEKVLSIAAHLLEVASDDVEMTDSTAYVRGAAARSVPLARIAQMANAPTPNAPLPAGMEPGLEYTTYFAPEKPTFSNGAHAVFVEVDPESGLVKLENYLVAHDCGVVLNPMLLDGQVHGGVAQGIGNALTEELHYDREGQLLTSTYLDYLLPGATEVPMMETLHLETPSPNNPEGIKGAGEGGTIPVPAVVANAVDDALANLGVRVTHTPITPDRLRRLIRESRAND
ncbi:MAG: xanthine dehydrogenase family protein molybdopterin-binding subunit [Chloroflexota bacterium]